MNELSLIYTYKPKKIDDLQYLTIFPILKSFLAITNYKILLQGNSSVGKTTIIQVILNELKDKTIFSYEDLVDYHFTIPLDKPNPICVIDNLDTLPMNHQIKLKHLCKDITLIATCTSYNKIVDSLMIKTMIFNINSPSTAFIKDKLKYIITKENISIDTQCIDYIINLTNNSLGASINYLDKIKLLNIHCSLDICKQLETNIGRNLWERYTILCNEGDLCAVKQVLKEINSLGFTVLDILDSYYSYIKYSDIFSDEISYEIIKLIMVYTHHFYLYNEDSILLLFFTNKLILLLSNEPSN